MKERIGKMKNTKKKGFTLVELLVVIAIMAILALIAVPNFSGYIDKSRDARIQSDLKAVYSAAIVSIEDSDGINLDDAVEKSDDFNESIKSLVNFSSDESEEQYYGRYEFLNKQNQLVVEYEDVNGKTHYYPKEVGMIGDGETGENEDPNYGDEYLATDDDFTWTDDNDGYTATNETGKGYYRYEGDKTTVKIPHVINGHPMTSYYSMFEHTSVTKVISDNSNVTNMRNMFAGSQKSSLDLSSFNTSKVTNMYAMFSGSQATTLDLSNFDTSRVTDMRYMFQQSKATTLDLSSFDTSKVTDMRYMFQQSKATTLDLSSFDTSKVTDMSWMFSESQATTGYARTLEDAVKFNANCWPSELTFEVKQP